MERIAELIIKRAEKFGDATVLFSETEETLAVYNRGIFKGVNSGKEAILKIRLSKGNRVGFAQTTNIDKWEKCLSDAVKIMKASAALETNILTAGPQKFRKPKGTFSKKVEGLSPEKLIDSCEKGIAAATNVDKRISVSTASASMSKARISVLNSSGVQSHEKGTMFSFSAETCIDTASGADYLMSHDLFDTANIGKKAAELCRDSINPKPIKTFNSDIVFSPIAFSEFIVCTLVPALKGYNIYNKKSYLCGKLGQKVFSDKLNVIDDGLATGGLMSSESDAEGVASQKTELIKSGMVSNFLYDLYSARLAGAESTGNCADLNELPSVAPTNFTVSPGDHSEEELVASVKKGMFAQFIIGAHVINPITGDASVALMNPFYIENGRIAFPVKEALVSFNVFEALKEVDALGKKLRQEGPIVCPAVKFNNVQIIG